MCGFLLLASTDLSEHAQFIPTLGFYRTGAAPRELLGYGGWDASLEISLELELL
jgi:hypothetical protein